MEQTRQNRIQSFAYVIVVFLAFCFSLDFFGGSRRDKSAFSRCDIELDGRVNPNNAPIESLVRLPGLGIGRAGAIVAYRENFRKNNGNSLAFEDCNDLLKVGGIGPKTVQSVNEWLKFE